MLNDNFFYKKYTIVDVILLIEEEEKKGEKINRSTLFKHSKTDVTNTTIRKAVDDLLRSGCIIGIRKEHGREFTITLTDKGRRCIETIKIIENAIKNLPYSIITTTATTPL